MPTLGRAILVAAIAACLVRPVSAAEEGENVVLAVHGGTGVPSREELTPELERAMREDLTRALRAGHAALSKGTTPALDAVEAAIRVLEDSPHFNAGRGAVLTREGKVELDAAIMEGKTRRGGGVASVTTVKNPIAAARAVMEQTKHVLLIGPGADEFAREAKLELVPPEYFHTPRRKKQLEDDLRREREQSLDKERGAAPRQSGFDSQAGMGTVGAVARDTRGSLAAGTSTGGTSKKLPGRVGGVPVLGSATFADDETCAVSGTGHGEYFLRFAVAHEIASRVRYRGDSIAQALDDVVQRQLGERGAEAGVIVLAPDGKCAMSFNSAGLARGLITADGKVTVRLYEN